MLLSEIHVQSHALACSGDAIGTGLSRIRGHEFEVRKRNIAWALSPVQRKTGIRLPSYVGG